MSNLYLLVSVIPLVQRRAPLKSSCFIGWTFSILHLFLVAFPGAPALSPCHFGVDLCLYTWCCKPWRTGSSLSRSFSPTLQLLFFKHMSEPLCATQLKRRTAMLVEKSATSFPTYYSFGQCCHTMPWNDSWAFGVAPVRHFCSLEVIFWLLSRTKIGLISSNMPWGMMSWWIYRYIRLSTSLFLLPSTPAA